MKIHEYQAKALLKEYGVPISNGVVVQKLEEVEPAYKKLNAPLIAVKAQIHAGGRGKAGGVKIAKSLEETKIYASQILGKTLVTHQTGPQGRKVRTVYLEAGTVIAKEMYLAVLLDRECSKLTVVAAAEGGMEIEELAAHKPQKILKMLIDPLIGVRSYHVRELASHLKIKNSEELAGILRALVRAYLELDATLIEINPLILTADQKLLALDAKITFDDNALYRHKNIQALHDPNEEDPLELEAKQFGLNYIALNGSIGCMVNGAGLAMATMDAIKLAGAEPANFLDVGGGASKEAVTAAFRIILKDPKVKAILVNIFGGIMKCDIIASGILEAVKQTELKLPLVVRLQGTHHEEGRKILLSSQMKITTAETMEEAATKVVQLAK